MPPTFHVNTQVTGFQTEGQSSTNVRRRPLHTAGVYVAFRRWKLGEDAACRSKRHTMRSVCSHYVSGTRVCVASYNTTRLFPLSVRLYPKALRISPTITPSYRGTPLDWMKIKALYPHEIQQKTTLIPPSLLPAEDGRLKSSARPLTPRIEGWRMVFDAVGWSLLWLVGQTCVAAWRFEPGLGFAVLVVFLQFRYEIACWAEDPPCGLESQPQLDSALRRFLLRHTQSRIPWLKQCCIHGKL